jgi:hypothetical protein
MMRSRDSVDGKRIHAIDAMHIRMIAEVLCARIESFAAIRCGNLHNWAIRGIDAPIGAKSPHKSKASSVSGQKATGYAVNRCEAS